MTNGDFKLGGRSVYLRPDLEASEFLKDLHGLDSAIFDFDGTVYPRMFLFDLTKDIFSMEENKAKLLGLNEIAGLYKKGDFKVAYGNFFKLLEGESREKFKRRTEDLIKDSYEYAKRTIAKLDTEYGIKSYLISLTSDFIADVVKKNFDFKEVFSVKYSYDNSKGTFTGDSPDIITDPQKIKSGMLKNLETQKLGKFISFFDSEDDLSIAKYATFRVGINPRESLLEEADFDLILKDNMDPWRGFYELICS
jgi:phosphoserine phosphatase